MAQSISNALKPVVSFEVAKVPVGQGAALAVGMGIGDVVKALAATFTPSGQAPGMVQLIAGIGLAWGLNNVKQVKNLIGADLARLISLAIVADTLNDHANLQQRTSDMIAGLTGGRVVSNSPPVWHRRQLPAGNSNAGLAGANRGTVQGTPRSGLYQGVF